MCCVITKHISCEISFCLVRSLEVKLHFPFETLQKETENKMRNIFWSCYCFWPFYLFFFLQKKHFLEHNQIHRICCFPLSRSQTLAVHLCLLAIHKLIYHRWLTISFCHKYYQAIVFKSNEQNLWNRRVFLPVWLYAKWEITKISFGKLIFHVWNKS